MDSEKKFVGKWWMWILGLVIVSLIALGLLSSLGLIGQTIVERKVFENSYQRSETLISEIATYEAQLAEINRKLSSDLDPQTRMNIEAQASAIRIMMGTARRKQ